MSCNFPRVLRLVVPLVACGPFPGDPSGGSTQGAGETSSGEPLTTEAPPTTTDDPPTGDGTTTDDPTTGDGNTTDDPTTGSPGACDVAEGDHAAVCRGPGCPIALDLEIRCHDRDFASRGMSVASTPDATWLAAGSYHAPMLFRADAGGAESIPGVVDAYKDTTLLMTQGPDGAPHIAVDALGDLGPDGELRHLTLVDGAWTDDVMIAADSILWLIDVDVDSQGRPHAFFYESLAEAYGVAVLDGGAWTTHSLAAPGPWVHFVLGPDDQEIALTAPDQQLQAFIGDQTVALGSPLPPFDVQYQAATGAPGPILAAALQLGDALELAWWPAPAAVVVPDTPAVGDACSATDADGPDSACPGPCHDDAVGMSPDAFSFTRTADGVGWLAWIITHRDRDAHYQLTELEGDYFCGSTLDRDDSFGMLHLARVGFDGPPVHVLTLPVSDVAGDLYEDGYINRRSPVVLTAFGADLTLALRLLGDEPPYQELPYARVLRIDTTMLP